MRHRFVLLHSLMLIQVHTQDHVSRHGPRTLAPQKGVPRVDYQKLFVINLSFTVC